MREAGLVSRGLRPDPCAVSSIRVQGAVEEVAEVLSPSLLVTTLGQAPQTPLELWLKLVLEPITEHLHVFKHHC